jgi:3-dehydroquinate synthetase
VNSEAIVKRLLSDKKTVGGVPHFVLPTSIGTVEVVNTVPERAILHAVEEIKKLSEA